MLLRSRRCTIRSTKPCSSKNSLVWKPLGQLNANRLFDHARAGETDQGLWFRDDDIAQ